MIIETWYIEAQTGFHFGEHGIGQEASGVMFPSDSLFAALVAQLALIKPSEFVNQWCQAYNENPPFLLTSAFPRAGDQLFFPLPLNLWEHLSEPITTTGQPVLSPKAIKRISYVSKDILDEILTGKFENFIHGRLLQNGELILTQSNLDMLDVEIKNHKQLWKISKRPRVTVGREASQSNLFHTGITTFSKNCGLWFGVIWRSDDHKDRMLLEILLGLLCDSGLGGERSAGLGAAQIIKQTSFEMPDPENGPVLLLSRYCPKPEELGSLKHPSARYRLVRVGGWAQSPEKKAQRRKTVNLIEAGAVLHNLPDSPAGCLVDVRPTYDVSEKFPHPIWRSGLAAGIGFEGGLP